MTPALQTFGLCRTFGDLVAVDALDLQVEAGEIFGFLGPNGAGKTTAISMMTGLLTPTAGRTEVLGREVTPGGDPEIRSLVGVCPQETVLWNLLTAEENLVFVGEMYNLPRRESRDRARALLDRLGLDDKADAAAESLSGGMKRRLNLAMALMHDPKVVFLDEPEAGLDPQARVVVRDFIRTLRKERTVVLTTHNMDEAERLVDRVGVIDKGRIIALDTPETLKKQHGAGDVVEIKVKGSAEAVAARLASAGLGEAHALDSTVVLRAFGLATRLPDVLEEAKASGVDVEDVRYRGNTLEDVFISLTGRGLRE